MKKTIQVILVALLPVAVLAATQIITNESTFEFVNQRGYTMPRSNGTPATTVSNISSGYALTFEVGAKLGYRLAQCGGSLDDLAKMTEAYRTNDYKVAEALFRNPKDPCEATARKGVQLGWLTSDNGYTLESALLLVDTLATNPTVNPATVLKKKETP